MNKANQPLHNKSHLVNKCQNNSHLFSRDITDSSADTKKKLSIPHFSRIALIVSLEQVFAISFLISREYMIQLPGGFFKITLPMFSFFSPWNFRIDRKPHLLSKCSLSSWPRKGKPSNKSNLDTSAEAVKWALYSALAYLIVYLMQFVWIAFASKTSHLLTHWLYTLFTPPISFLNLPILF